MFQHGMAWHAVWVLTVWWCRVLLCVVVCPLPVLQVYVHRTRECVNGLRSLQPNAPPQAKATRGKHMTELATVLAAQSKKKTADQ